MSFDRFQHNGAAVQTTLTADITSSDASCSIADSTGWPDGSVGPFWIVLDAGVVGEEKALVTARSGTSLTGMVRGQDSTTAAIHASGAVVKHIFSALEADEANRVAAATLGAVTTKGDLLAGTGANVLARLGVGADGLPLVAAASQSTGLQYAALSSTGLASGAVTAAKMAANSVASANIIDGTIVEADLANDAVTAAKLADAAVVAASFGSGIKPEFIVADDTARNDLIAALGGASAAAGIVVYQLDTDVLWVFTGVIWRAVSGLEDDIAYTGTAGSSVTLTSATYIAIFPTMSLDVPTWATACILDVHVSGLTVATDTTAFDLLADLGGVNDATDRIFGAVNGTGAVRHSFSWSTQLTGITLGTQTLTIEGKRTGSGTGSLGIDSSSQCDVVAHFTTT